MITLCFRFIAVFMVLFFIQIALQLASRVVRRIEAPRVEAPGRLPLPPPVPALAATGPETERGPGDVGVADQAQRLDAGTLVAVGLALELERRASREANGHRPTNGGRRTSAWAVAGRMNQTGLR